MIPEKISRRAFLKRLGFGLAALEASHWLPPLRHAMPVAHGQNFPLAAVAAGDNNNSAAEILQLALDGIGGLARFVQPGAKVVIKPNATWAYPPNTASSTDPEMLRAIIRMVKDAGAGHIQVVDHCSIDPGSPAVLRVNGIAQIVKDEDVEGIFPDRTNAPPSTYTRLELPNGKAFDNLGVIKAAIEADVRINLGVAKSHNVTKMTMCLKHMMGFLQAPGLLHANLEQGIADLSSDSPLKADLHILEAIRVRLPYKNYRVCAGPETDLTNPNVVRRVNEIVAGSDPVLIDAYGCSAYFDLLPEELTHVLRAYESGIGAMDFQTAIEDGRMALLNTRVLPTPVPSATQATVEAAAPVDLSVTPTPRPTGTPLANGAGDVPVGVDAAANCAPQQVLDPAPVLGAALIPAAVIAAGAGLVVRNRRHAAKQTAEPPDEE